MEKLMRQVEDQQKATTLRAEKAENAVKALETERAQLRTQLAKAETTISTLEGESAQLRKHISQVGVYPSREAVKARMEAQAAEIASMRERSKGVSDEVTTLLESAGGHLIQLAKDTRSLKEVSDSLLSLDKVVEEKPPPSPT
eukprot:TRINITY_DN1921_c0_g1_i2.p1 TRINITY_DN1921_c0_g1~~TRINITY_DN1921_c0_g1_i2.p1  ORF type:complete len:143 (-),score=28.86 TRINITY_DN1921_c0_g1_i2:99-527(-)